MHKGRSLALQADFPKGWVVCGTVYGEMHLKDLLGSIVRVGYRIPVPDFYLVLHGLRCQKSTVMDLSINQSYYYLLILAGTNGKMKNNSSLYFWFWLC